ncbi:MAG: hypothetical protein ACREJC_08245 [Tepidisphaeraceae bacterium]
MSGSKIVSANLAFVGALAASQMLRADVFVIPSVWTDLEGDRRNFFPFTLTPSNLTSQRYQQIYAADEFLPLGTQVISRIAFRADGAEAGAFSFTIPHITLSLSTTSQVEDGLSLVFADNIGPDELVVYDGAWSLSGALSDAAPHGWDFYFDLTTPFVFNPSSGNLLLDVRNYGGDVGLTFDVTRRHNDGVSRVYTRDFHDVFSPEGDIDSLGLGLITQFTSVSVPEPAGFLAAVGLLICTKRRR